MTEPSQPFAWIYLEETLGILMGTSVEKIERCVQLLAQLRARGGRLFVLGVGGSAANASHAVNDFRKLCGIEAYAPTDNVAELTARTNDEDWARTFDKWLETSHLGKNDMLLVLSVGGGSASMSPNIAAACDYAMSVGACIIAFVGRKNGAAAQNAEVYLMPPIISEDRITPHAEEFQSIMWHLMVSHPDLRQ